MFSQGEKDLVKNIVALILECYPDRADVHTDKVLDFKEPKDLRKIFDFLLHDKGIGTDALVAQIQQIIKYSVNTGHPLFLNQLSGGPNIESVIGEFLCAILNPTMATYEVAPVATFIERSLITNLNGLLGFKSREGIMVTGGSNGNLIGVLCARHRADRAIRREGTGQGVYRIYVSADAHYSYSRAANIAGIGSNNMVSISVDNYGRMIPAALERQIQIDLKAGHLPMMIGATAGTTVYGAFDPLPELSHIAQKFSIWLHVDAAWGGSCIFSERERHRLRGVDQADSVSLDGHKSLSTGLITSFFLSRHDGVLKDTTGDDVGADYLFHADENSDLNLGTSSFQCGRRADALKLWLLWKIRGKQGIENLINRQVDLASYAREKVRANKRLVYVRSNYLNVCFQIQPIEGSQFSASDLTLRSRDYLLRSGQAMVNYASDGKGLYFYRLVFPNSRTQESDVDFLLTSILKIADTIESTAATNLSRSAA